MKNPVVTIEMESGNKITAELYPEIAPNTVRNFVSLVQKGFYDGLIFHRVIPGYCIKGEFSANRFPNDLKHDRGVLSMARAMDPDSAGSQFFIMTEKAPHLDGQYAAFGKVTDGMDEVDRIVSAKRDRRDKPHEDQRMAKVTVETFGETFEEPETC